MVFLPDYIHLLTVMKFQRVPGIKIVKIINNVAFTVKNIPQNIKTSTRKKKCFGQHNCQLLSDFFFN